MIILGSFLAGAIMSLLIPVGVFIAIGVWHVLSLGRVPSVKSWADSPPDHPSSEKASGSGPGSAGG